MGDGNQLTLMNYENYLGLDVSKTAILNNIAKFSDDPKKSFGLYYPQYFRNNNFINVDLSICLDVLYHIDDEADYRKTLSDTLQASDKHVVLYTSIDRFQADAKTLPHVKHRDILNYLAEYDLSYEIIRNEHPELSSADFIIINK